MSFLITRSIPLGRSTMHAWREVGGVFMRRGSTTLEILTEAQRHDFLLNLGRTNFTPMADLVQAYGVTLLNHGNDIAPLVTPGDTRTLFGDLMPPQRVGEVWVKSAGFGGRGKTRCFTHVPLVLPPGWDWQGHVEGQEYRLVTVGNRIVQCFQRFGDNSHREYLWIRMREVNINLKEIVWMAASRLQGCNVVAWDTIVEGEVPYIFEGNTCPGMSVNTANRIVREVLHQREEEQ